MTFTLSELAAEADREVRMREHVFGRRVAAADEEAKAGRLL